MSISFWWNRLARMGGKLAAKCESSGCKEGLILFELMMAN